MIPVIFINNALLNESEKILFYMLINLTAKLVNY